jgi:hypothetical protein
VRRRPRGNPGVPIQTRPAGRIASFSEGRQSRPTRGCVRARCGQECARANLREPASEKRQTRPAPKTYDDLQETKNALAIVDNLCWVEAISTQRRGARAHHLWRVVCETHGRSAWRWRWFWRFEVACRVAVPTNGLWRTRSARAPRFPVRPVRRRSKQAHDWPCPTSTQSRSSARSAPAICIRSGRHSTCPGTGPPQRRSPQPRHGDDGRRQLPDRCPRSPDRHPVVRPDPGQSSPPPPLRSSSTTNRYRPLRSRPGTRCRSTDQGRQIPRART